MVIIGICVQFYDLSKPLTVIKTHSRATNALKTRRYSTSSNSDSTLIMAKL